ncbi:MAG: phosphoglucomutase/phosphomannomutase family protein [Candidatus Melainabacteria bacterium]|nr:MAG: phosphoglucomutase/phosphomannomutase family protein [Candidatus Melainabacteria bacterium]
MSDVISFGTDGWRAIIAEDFTFANVEKVAYAMGMYVRNTYHRNGAAKVPLLVGYDTRFMADRFALRCAQTLITMGIPAKVVERDVPTPCIAHATQHEPTAGALQFTASHNPPEYCGIKYIPHFAGPATDDITAQIVSHLNDKPDDFHVDDVEVPRFDPTAPYLASLKELIDFKKISGARLRIGYDALYSTSRGYLDKMLKEAGVNVTVLHDWRDPLFGGGMPEPKYQYLQDLVKTVRAEKLDAGLATDGDADRFAAIDEGGNYLSPNHLLCLLTRHLVKNHGKKGPVVRTVATTHLLDRLCQMYGLDYVETAVGFKYVGEQMRLLNGLIGGEESGGVTVMGHIPEKDGIMANLLLVEMMAYEGKSISAIWQDMVKEAGLELIYRRADLKLTMRTQKGLMDRLRESPMTSLAGLPVTEVGRKDGLKLYLDHHNWVLIRPSGTEPLVRLYFEGTNVEQVEKVMADFNQQVDKILAEFDSKPVMEAAARH